MLATLTGEVLAVRERTTHDGKVFATVYLLQPNRQEPVQTYCSPSDLVGGLPKQGDRITAEVLVYVDRQQRLAVRLDTCEVAAKVAA